MKNFFKETKFEQKGEWFWIALVFVFFVFSLSSFLFTDVRTASPPAVITYQGKLVENGAAVTTTKAISFYLYNASAGGSLLYTAGGTLNAPSSINVTPSQGIFSVDLGGSGTNELTTSTFANNSNLYLEVWVGATQLTPRKKLTAAPFAINSQYLMGITATTTSSSVYIPHSDANGNFTFSGTPQSSGVGGGVIYVNPGSADQNETLVGLAVGGVEKFRVDAEGDAWITGTTTISGDLNVDGGALFVDHLNNFVGINSSTPSVALSVNGESYFSGTTTFAGPLVTLGNSIHPVSRGSVDTGADDAYSVVVEGDYAYVANGTDGLVIVDISDKAHPTVVSTLVDSSGSGATALAVSGNYVYLINGQAMDIIDISNPKKPVRLKTFSYGIGTTFYDVVVSGNYAYLALGPDGVLIVDITKPLLPAVRSTFDPGASLIANVILSGHYLYGMAAGVGYIFDVANPAAISLAGSFTSAAALNDMFLSGKYLYLSTDASGLLIYDVTDVRSPSLVGSLAYGIMGADVQVAGDYAYYQLSDSLRIIDITDKTAPVEVSSFNNLGNQTWGFDIVGNYFYGANDVGLEVIDMTGLKTSNIGIGNAEIDNVQVSGGAEFGQNVRIKGGINLGGGLQVNGDIGVGLPTSTDSGRNRVRFSNGVDFVSNATGTATNLFVFDSYHIFPETSSSTTYLLSVRNNGIKAFSVASNGDVAASGTLYAASVSIGTPGHPGDLAEKVDIAPDDTAEPGDVMVVDSTREDTYRRSSGPYEQAVAGVISTNPVLTIGFGKTSNSAVLAMVGRVPIKVSAENGPISRGDILVTASTTGYAMRYDASKDDDMKIVGIIGVALEPLSEGQGKIMGLIRTGFVNNRHKTIADIQQELTDLADAQSGRLGGQELSVGENNGQLVFLQNDLNANAYSILNVKRIAGIDGKWEVDDEGRFITRVDTTDGKKNLYSLQSGETELVFSGSSHLVAGVARVDFDDTTKELIDPEKPIKVNITLTSEALGVFISGKDATGFVVKELQGGASAATFDWVVIASRKIASDTPPQVNNDQQAPPSEQNSNPPADENPPAQNENNNAGEENPPAQEENNPPANAPQDEAPPQNQPEEQNPPADQSQDSAPPESSSSEG